MLPLLENGQLITDLECNYKNLLHVGGLFPVPYPLVSTSDPRLTDARNPLPGSVFDSSVSGTAGIVQSKLNLNGLIPGVWMGTTSLTAAQGNLVEYFTNKALPNGYASLDGTGKVPVSQLPVGAGGGTITSIGLSMPAMFTVTGSPVTVSGTLGVAWNSVSGSSWFGNATGGSAVPTFNTLPLPLSLIPSLPASQVSSGVFAFSRLPLAVGVGSSHAPGAAPDPGASGSPFDYLGRDMAYHTIPQFGPSYQPVVPNPSFSITVGPPPYIVSITDPLPGTSLFYSIGSPVTGFQPVPTSGQISIANAQTVYAYGAMAGYTNSPVVKITSPMAPPTELVIGDDALPITGDDGLNVTVGP